MRCCVQGLWHLGSVTAACLASVGHDVIGLDYDTTVIDNLQNGHAPLFEPGLDELLQQGLTARTLHFTTSAEQLGTIEILWLAYDTPVDEDDNADTFFVIEQLKKTLPHLPSGCLILVSSQLPVGSTQILEAYALSIGKDVSFACSPENLRLGKALDIFLNPDRIVVGIRSENAQHRLEKLLFPITHRIEWMGVESAEMTKHAINSFLALSVTFANELATICEKVGANAQEVTRGLKSEQRIGPKAYLAPGAAFAGGTLARDITFLQQIALQKQLHTVLLDSVKSSNDFHKLWVRNKLLAQFGSLDKRVIAVWGLTYKPGTDTLRRSLSVELCDWLLAQGVVLHVHDSLIKKLPKRWQGLVKQFADPVEALQSASALVLGTEWPEYKSISSFPSSNICGQFFVYDTNGFLTHCKHLSHIRHVTVGCPEDTP